MCGRSPLPLSGRSPGGIAGSRGPARNGEAGRRGPARLGATPPRAARRGARPRKGNDRPAGRNRLNRQRTEWRGSAPKPKNASHAQPLTNEPTPMDAQRSEPRQRRAGAQTPAEGLRNIPRARSVAERNGHNLLKRGGGRGSRRQIFTAQRPKGRGKSGRSPRTHPSGHSAQAEPDTNARRGTASGPGGGEPPRDHRRKAKAAGQGAAQSGRRKGRPRRGRGEEAAAPKGAAGDDQGAGAGQSPGGAPTAGRATPSVASG